VESFQDDISFTHMHDKYVIAFKIV